MKILQVAKFYHPFKGGIETVVKNLAEGLQKRGDEVTVLCSSHTKQDSEEMIHGIRVIRIGTLFTLFSQPICPGMSTFLKKNAKNYDVIHIHSPNPLVELNTLVWKNHPPIFVTYHSDIIRQKWALPFYMPLLNRFLNRADRIIVPTQQHITYSPLLPRFEQKCRIIPFGLEPNKFLLTDNLKSQVEDLRKKYGRFVLFVGRLVPYKGATYLIEAMKDIPCKLLIVGTGPLQQELEAQAKKLGISDQILFLGNIDDHTLTALYHSSELLILPSINRSEAFGMVLIEAMACSKPLITTRLPSGVTFVNQEGVTGLQVSPMNSAELHQAILKVLNDTELSTRMSREAKRRFEQLFTFDRMIQSYQEAYLSAV